MVFQCKIKEEALLQIDGDFDIIWKDFKTKKIKSENKVTDFESIIAGNIENEKNKSQKKTNAERF